MERLTHERIGNVNKSGYWSPAKKQELIDKLALYENIGLSPEEIKEKICDQQWIRDRLPTKKEKQAAGYVFNVTIDGMKMSTELEITEDGEWVDEQENIYRVIAWKKMPEGYKECD